MQICFKFQPISSLLVWSLAKATVPLTPVRWPTNIKKMVKIRGYDYVLVGGAWVHEAFVIDHSYCQAASWLVPLECRSISRERGMNQELWKEDRPCQFACFYSPNMLIFFADKQNLQQKVLGKCPWSGNPQQTIPKLWLIQFLYFLSHKISSHLQSEVAEGLVIPEVAAIIPRSESQTARRRRLFVADLVDFWWKVMERTFLRWKWCSNMFHTQIMAPRKKWRQICIFTRFT